MKNVKTAVGHYLKISILLIFAVQLLFSTGVSAESLLPAFQLQDAKNGEDISSQQFEGKALLVTFFATWCGPCLQEIPNLIKLQKKFGKDGFSVLGLSVDQGGRSIVKKLINKYSINYPVLMAKYEVGQALGGIRSIPASFLFNKKGKLVKKYSLGYIPHSEFENDIKRVLD